jgi:tetratricopeptide (TPR) repeat protein/predicted Ser/Thr protein kinase
MDSTTRASDEVEVRRHFEGVEAPFGDDTRLGVDMVAAKLFGASSPPARVGGYVILRELGSGGMGVVYAGYDERLDRRVAIKLLRDARGNEAARARLHREAQAMARLAHPNVITVHEVGIHEGQLFVAMEFVAGKTLGAWMRERGSPRPWPEVLEVFIAAGRGLAAAHEAGLVHRDFKPENVMVGDDGRVRVMDFGLARVDASELVRTGEVVAESSSSSRLTQTGVVMGTPAYMSLEQFDGAELDARSDQFSFCVALYEALHGERPFAGESVRQLVRALEHGEVRTAPAGTSVPTWLRSVIVKGLAKDRAQRWPSMRALLEALADDPAPRRRRWAAAAMVVAMLGGATWAVAAQLRADARVCQIGEEHLAGIWDAERRAEIERAILGTELSYAPGTWERVEQGLDEYTQQWLAAREQACEATHNGEQSQELLDLRMACLDERLRHVRATVDVLAEADETVTKKAAEAVANLPRLERCADVDALRASIPPPEDPQVARRVEVLDEQLARAEALEKAGKYAEGLVLADAVVAEATTLGYEPVLTRAWLRQGILQELMGEDEAAEATLERAYASAVGQQMPVEAASASGRLVYVVGAKLGRYQEGRRWAKDAEPLARAADTHDTRTVYRNSLGAIAWAEGNLEEARGYVEQGLAIKESALGPEHPDVAASLNNLGLVLNSQGNYEEARDYHSRALAIFEKALGPEHPDTARSVNNLGYVAESLGNHEEARDYFERGLAISKEALGPEHPYLATCLNNVGRVANSLGNYEEARGYLERSLAIREKTVGLEHPDTARVLTNLGKLAESQGKYEEARSYHQRALTIFEKALGPEHSSVASAHANLGSVAHSEGKYEEARGYHERALAIWEKALGPEDPYVAFALTSLGKALLGQHEPGEALPHLERASTIRTATPGDPTELAETHFALARALWDAPAEAGRDRERARTLADLARRVYADAGETGAKELRDVQAWQAEHDE